MANTPIPWNGIPWTTMDDPREIVSEADGRYIALDDLRLIAAAPELLAVCEAAIDEDSGLICADALRAAIAKAKGKA